MAIGTRESNATAHPGDNHKKYDSQRRSSDQVKADKRKAAAEKAEKKARKLQGIDKAAQIENDARRKARDQRDNTGISGKGALAIPRVRHTPPMAVDPEDKGDKEVTKKKKKIRKIVYEEVTDDEETDGELEDDRKSVEESGSSGSEFQQPEGDNESDESNSDDDEEMVDAELDDDEPDTAIEVKKVGEGKKEKKGVTKRNEIRQARDKHENSSTAADPEKSSDTSLKRKASTKNTDSKSKKSKTNTVSGVYDDWDKCGTEKKSLSKGQFIFSYFSDHLLFEF
ncbi:hypothetical protein CPB84DRAFT_1003925 [Gymnopilus junonius]|uniref:Uncharacterized protein n=1 Tax=Gymnopilus junonius TaxID=109634 RepID=A0A9P5N8N3_GYMJU|nr:hypothetical protein CPB84DRAFT_1003925 [Gymnopilus junonius]